jgi:hypothetical protein
VRLNIFDILSKCPCGPLDVRISALFDITTRGGIRPHASLDFTPRRTHTTVQEDSSFSLGIIQLDLPLASSFSSLFSFHTSLFSAAATKEDAESFRPKVSFYLATSKLGALS